MTKRVATAHEASPATTPRAQPELAGGFVATGEEGSRRRRQELADLRCLGLPTASFANRYSQVADTEASAAKERPRRTIITSSLLIPGDGEPLPDGALVVEGKTIIWVGDKADIPQEYTQSPHKSYHVPYMMPGLWDVHVHFLDLPSDPDQLPAVMALESLSEHPAGTGARLAKQCWEAIQLGYTSLRDCGGFGCELAKVINDGGIVGPNVYSAGSYLSQTAGHGDIFTLPPGDALLNLGIHNVTAGYWGSGFCMMVDGVDECRRAVRLQIRRGARCIKVFASGGVVSRDDNPLDQQFSDEELRVIVEEANRMGRGVAAHVHGKAGILAAASAGVTTVEHATFADQECIDILKEKDIIYVATRAVVARLIETGGEGIPKSTWEKVQLINKNHLAAYKLAVQNGGITFALGTDGRPGDGGKAKELQYAVEAGMSNLEAIRAATANGPRTLGGGRGGQAGQVPRSGRLEVGYDADILGLLENPAENVRVLQRGEVVRWVWKGGRLYKGPGVGPWGEEA
ncbi:amidohydrolase [Purpureocillium lilacinum]|uniref:Amidohydrolase n=1 Tax=Purpureocillium lilacinum TaxID=33203 RepID=A0A179HQ43_PURLI|nr:amidohydrolase [Purpureocillium lilacinum]OAQ92467.1 amidohydrolase [Purpureocillium lilacinum]